MISKFKIIMLFVLLGLSCFIFSCECLNSKSKTPWLYYDTLDFIELESPKVKRIIICFSDDDDPDNWMPFVEISDPEKIKKALEALRNAERGFMPDLFCKMKIITEHKKFIRTLTGTVRLATASIGNQSNSRIC